MTATKGSKLRIIYEDDEIIVIDKPSGLLTMASDKKDIQRTALLTSMYS